MEKTSLMILVLVLLPTGIFADQEVHTNPGNHRFPADYHEGEADPEAGGVIGRYADDAQSGPQQKFGVQPVHDDEIFAVFHGDRFEYRSGEGNEILLWDVLAWIGTDYNKLYLESEGTWSVDEDEFEEAEVELFYGRNVTTFWDLQVGFRHDFKPHPRRSFAALGAHGLAPLWFETDATVYVSEDGDISGNLEVEYDLLITQRLILQPRIETNLAVQDVPKYGVGSGINDVELGARLRYEIRREFAPYLGISWHRKIGESADFVREEGGDIDVLSFVAGVRLWF
jgi:copper resistance protein B